MCTKGGGEMHCICVAMCEVLNLNIPPLHLDSSRYGRAVREGERGKRGREGGRDKGREEGRGGGRQGGKEGGREGGTKGGREGGWEEGMEKDRGRE